MAANNGVNSTKIIIFRYGAGGALVCDCHIPGISTRLEAEAAKFYGGAFFIGESLSKGACKIIVNAFNGEFIE